MHTLYYIQVNKYTLTNLLIIPKYITVSISSEQVDLNFSKIRVP
jgi:hypothetical protein